MEQYTLTLLDCVDDADRLKNHLTKKGWNHKCFKTYSTLERIQSWVDSNCFYLDDGSRWNDPYDSRMFNNDRSIVKRFGRCFSFSITESVAMWMLYGGMEKKGAMLEFKGAAMRELINKTSVVELGNWENGEFKIVKALTEGQYVLELKDILYRDKEDADGIYICRAKEVCKKAPVSLINELDHCVKSVAWSYEEECRLILSVNKADVPEVLNASSVRISLHNMLKDPKKTNIYRSPNFTGKKLYQESKLAGGIDWDLCAGCKKQTPADT